MLLQEIGYGAGIQLTVASKSEVFWVRSGSDEDQFWYCCLHSESEKLLHIRGFCLLTEKIDKFSPVETVRQNFHEVMEELLKGIKLIL